MAQGIPKMSPIDRMLENLRAYIDEPLRPIPASPPAPSGAEKKSRLRELRSQEPMDAMRFREWFKGRDGKTLDDWRDIIDNHLKED